MSKHGTATFTLEQCSQISAAIDLALPRALSGLDPKRIIPGMQKKGELFAGVLRHAIRSIAEGNISQIISTYADSLLEGGEWELLEDVGYSSAAFDPAKAKGISLGKRLEKHYCDGEDILASAKEFGPCLGQRHAEYFMKNPEQLWEKAMHPEGVVFVFAGTIWGRRVHPKYPRKSLYVPALAWGTYGKKAVMYLMNMDISGCGYFLMCQC